MTLIDTRGRPLTHDEPAKAPPTMYSGASAAAAFDNPVWRSSSNPSRLFRELQGLYRHPWIGLAERTINNKVVGLPWHLEDADDEEIGDDASDDLRAIELLLEKPQSQLTGRAQMTRRDLWSITSRHLGLCGNSAWYLDNLDLLAETPTSILYLNPSRLSPVSDKAGHLIGWLLDSSSYDAQDGVPLSLSEVLHFKLDPPDWGHWAIGVAESAWMKSRLSEIGDRHTANLLASGGRLAGMLMPKEGVTLEPDAWASLIRDYRSITEDPQAAKRMQILKYPMDFTPTAANPEQIQLGDLLRMSRDDLLALWGVPLTQVGIPAPVGIGANVRSFDEAVLMQGAVHARIVAMKETIQFQLLDRWQKLGITVELEIEEPSYDDRTPQFDLIEKASGAFLTVDGRRELVGEEPLDTKVYGTLGQAIYVPSTLVRVDVLTEATVAPRPTPPLPEVETAPAKASIDSKRTSIAEQAEPAMRRSVASVLKAMRDEIAGWVKTHASHLAGKPRDTRWWNAAKWDRELLDALRPHASRISADMVADVAAKLKPAGKADPFEDTVSRLVLEKVGKRVTGINEYTRERVVSIIGQTVEAGINSGLGMAELGDKLEAALDEAKVFDEYRAELIARTETGTVLNEAAVSSYREFGIEEIEVLDGDGDELCAPWDGWHGPISDAPDALGHPNCTRSFVPYFREAA